MNKKAKIGLIILAFIILTISTKVYATNGKANQETVRMREEASTESSVVTLISLDEEVEVLSEEGEWYKIKYKTYTGYVRKDMLDVDEKTETAQNTNSENTTSSEEIKDKIEIGYTGTIASKLDLKLVPSITSSNINTIEENSKIIIKDIINKWSYVETDNKSGWVLTSKIKVSEQKNEEVKTEENKEQTVEETKKEENTEKTTSKEETKTEEKKKTEVTKYVSAETLNMRETANNNAKLINQLKVNTKVTVLETEGTWSKIKVNGKTGYVASKYLSDKKVDVTSRSEEITRNNDELQNENLQAENNEGQKEEVVVEEQKAENTNEEQEENKYISIKDVKISKDMDLTVRTGLSRADFITLISGVKADTSSFFEENAGTIYDLCEEYSLNEIFFCGIISAESGWDIASNHRKTHNYISLMSNGKLISYPSVESGLREAAKKLHTNYLTKGGKFYYGKTLTAVKTKFCPASSTWVSLVYGRMSQIIK